MRKGIVQAALSAVFFVSVLPFACPDALIIGGSAGWSAFADRRGVSESSGVRNKPVLTLSSAKSSPENGADMSLSFDDPIKGDAAGNYAITIPQSVSIAGPLRARSGNGAALFAGAEGGITVEPKKGSEALFQVGQRIGDFSIEFWLYPANMENGEQILSWNATRRSRSGDIVFQRIRCLVARNRVEWAFADFFSSPDEQTRVPIMLSTRGSLVPRTWSHHLIRFDSSLGLLEYLVDGKVESVVYATSSGGERGERYVPIVGSGGAFSLGPRFTGMIDEFRVVTSFVEKAALPRFPRAGGRAVTKLLDLGTTNAAIRGLDATFSAPLTSAARFFVRVGDMPYGWKDEEASWIPVEPGKPVPVELRGRWAQISCVLYPDGAGEVSPILEELRLDYEPDVAPPPPSMVMATAKNGAVELRWRSSSDSDVGGYLVYFGEDPSEYFGTSPTIGASPVDAGLATSFVVDGLHDGTLYYFAIAAYDRASPRHIGEFSREVTARPARTVR
ncbi:MAG: LamG-like jellyroll fold domain-containing protein [Treponemataceae bacterium]